MPTMACHMQKSPPIFTSGWDVNLHNDFSFVSGQYHRYENQEKDQPEVR